MKVGARFSEMSEIKSLFDKDFPVVGVGVTAFPRSGLSYILPNFKILSLLETSDLEAIREKCEVVSVEKGLGGEYPQKFNTSEIMRLPEVSKWLLGLGEVGLFLYKASIVTDRIVNNMFSGPILRSDSSPSRSGLKGVPSRTDLNLVRNRTNLSLLSTPGYIRKVFENKKEFRVEALKAGLNIPQGLTLRIEEVTDGKWENLKAEYGGRLVFQLTDYTIGGGLGTFFIDNKQDLEKFREFVERRRTLYSQGRSVKALYSQGRSVKGLSTNDIHHSVIGRVGGKVKGREINFVNVTERIIGRQASIAGCATYYGTVACVLQNQIMDQPELAALVGRSGVWLGQDWHVRFSERAQLAAEEQVKKWGKYIYKKGYKGIFGLDLMVTDEDEVKVIECNSRYTGAFPVLTMAQLANGEMPIDVWHLLEWMRIKYEMDIDEVQRVYRQPKQAAQLLLHNLERKFVMPTKTVKAGVYKVIRCSGVGDIHPLNKNKQPGIHRVNNNKQVKIKGYSSLEAINRNSSGTLGVEWLRPGFSLLDLKSEDEFVLCDRVPTEQMVIKPAERLGRLIFSRRIVTDEGELLPWTREVVRAVYDKYELAVVENPEV